MPEGPRNPPPRSTTRNRVRYVRHLDQILAVDEERMYLRYHQAKDLDDLGRFLIRRRDDEASWLDQLVPAEPVPA